MTTVNTSSDVHVFDNYTWSDASFVWERPETNWLTFGYTSYSLDVVEPFGLSDLCKKTLSCFYSDSLFLSDVLKNLFVMKFSDHFSFSDDFYSFFSGKFPVSFCLIDSLKKNLSCFYSDSLLLSDVGKSVTVFNRVFSEDFLLSDFQYSAFGKKSYEDFLLTDSRKGNFVKSLPEDFLLSDSLTYQSSFYRTFSEEFSFTDSLSSDFIKKSYDSFELTDFFKRGLDFSLSNFGFKTTDLTLSSFESSFSSPFGYSPFQEFAVGEYEYEKAVVRTSIISQNNNSNTAINKLDIHVDIPDTNDRGTFSIPNSNAFVPFNKTYYTKPEVQVNINGGVSGQVMIPHITEITLTGFYVELRDLSNNLVSGQISWSSNGY